MSLDVLTKPSPLLPVDLSGINGTYKKSVHIYKGHNQEIYCEIDRWQATQKLALETFDAITAIKNVIKCKNAGRKPEVVVIKQDESIKAVALVSKFPVWHYRRYNTEVFSFVLNPNQSEKQILELFLSVLSEKTSGSNTKGKVLVQKNYQIEPFIESLSGRSDHVFH